MDSFLTLFDMIGTLARRRYQAAERSFVVLGLNHTEARLLTLLNEAGGKTTQDKLSAGLLIDRSNAGRALKRLEADGYIRREKDATDKRTNHVAMTKKGEQAVSDIAKLRVQMAERFFLDLKPDEAQKVVTLLQKALPKDG
ncbi:MarR family winged helix-turn-helix transcriptional regulator [Kordiimonas marina]|uniref:MarR family winged helix-turn-helix transcriptional regulator n=1 Tax=Kordiimonas marina TaxID=2872312 RepID=UPI001FF53711|nr:MarR family transcriptional regulator [Kordiimonas marina]MCJ9428619.1 MarR family transcriptional regulator [Kordiimonas marina]